MLKTLHKNSYYSENNESHSISQLSEYKKQWKLKLKVNHQLKGKKCRKN